MAPRLLSFSLMLLASKLPRNVAFSTLVRRSPLTPVGALGRSMASATPATAAAESSDRLFPEELNIIYDSKCNVCKLEIDFLRNRDARVNAAQPRLRFTDLEGETGPYDPSNSANAGISYATGMASMHAVTPDGKIYTGVPVFRMAYENVGLGWLFVVTKWPVVQPLANFLYDVFAKYRTLITRGSSVERLVQLYEDKKQLEADQQKANEECQTCQPASNP